MQFSKTLLSLLPASLALAGPAPRPADLKSMRADEPDWIIESLKRTCNDADTQCDWTFRINTQGADSTDCTYSVQGSPASHATGALERCGVFTVQAGYNDQLGEDKKYYAVSIHDEARGLIVFASYSVEQIEGGQIVSPDQRYSPISLVPF
ncbi:unnamed protein product [Clonostachys rosea]|uniref:Small secreted protein n=1 Tax=Bionectria ochroleuca TaxID=29856 RepID=A0ABY6U217_BIOOC|nr:unnamed protein product [Clonostachys rosea]